MDWGAIEPAILGTLFERGLNPDMRSQLGAHYTDPATIFDAWSDEAWINNGAAVRVSLVCFGDRRGAVLDGQPVAEIHADLTAGNETRGALDLTQAKPLAENMGAAFIGTQKNGPFDIPGEQARQWLKLPNPNGRPNSDVIKPWANGMDITRRTSDTWVTDFGVGIAESEAALYETPFSHVVEKVKPTREHLNRAGHRKYWWRHGETRSGLRQALKNLPRFISTPRVSKYRLFIWLDRAVLPDSAVVAIARADDTTFGVLHSRFHELWSLGLCTWLGKGNDPRYTPTTTFETFPFPEGLTPRDTPAGRRADAIAAAAKKLNELRKNWLNPPEWVEWVRTPEEEQAGFPLRPVAKPGHEADLKKRTLTNLYNSRPAWLDNAHGELDAATAAAYGWPDYTPAMPDDEILRRLLALNIERSARN